MLLGITVFDESFRAVGERERESNRPLQFFYNTLPSFLLDQRKLIFWYKMHYSNNPVSLLYGMSRLHQNRFIAIGCKYGIDLTINNYVYVKEAVWRVCAGTVTL